MNKIACCIAFLTSCIASFELPAATSETHFSPEEWRLRAQESSVLDTNRNFNRVDEFKGFLRDYDLIGMQRDEVIRLLGAEDARSGYVLLAAHDSDCNVELRYIDGKVNCWRLSGFKLRNLNWQYKNVVWTSIGYKFDSKK